MANSVALVTNSVILLLVSQRQRCEAPYVIIINTHLLLLESFQVLINMLG